MRKPSRIVTIEETCWTPGFRGTFRRKSGRFSRNTRRASSTTSARPGLPVWTRQASTCRSSRSSHGPLKCSNRSLPSGSPARRTTGWLRSRVDIRRGSPASPPCRRPTPGAAVDELTRAVEELGLKGGLINGHTHGVYPRRRAIRPVARPLRAA